LASTIGQRLKRVAIALISNYDYENVTAPTVSTIRPPEDFFSTVRTGNKYDLLREMVRQDPELRGAVDRIGKMCMMAYGGIGIHAGESLTTTEELLLNAAREWADDDMEYAEWFEATAIAVMTYGDFLAKKIYRTGDGITRLQPFRMEKSTILDSKAQRNQTSAEIFSKNWYVMNEGLSKESFTVEKQMLHVPLNNKAQYVFDIKGRVTFGVWSSPPIDSLQGTIRWKMNTVLDDMQWRHANVPRPHHKINLSAYAPERYQGTWDQRVAASEAAAQTAANKYRDNLPGNMEADYGYVTDLQTNITFVESSSTNYQRPNELLDQQNQSISSVTGIPKSLLFGEGGPFASGLISSSFALMFTESLFSKVARHFTRLLRQHFRIQRKEPIQNHLNKLFIQGNIILERDRLDLARQLAILWETGMFTPTELRDMWGKDPLTEDQWEEIAGYIQKVKRHITPTEVLKYAKESSSREYPTYPKTGRGGM